MKTWQPNRKAFVALLSPLLILTSLTSASNAFGSKASGAHDDVDGTILIKVNEYADNPEKIIDRSSALLFQGIGMIQRERELAEEAKAIAKNIRAEDQAGHGTGINIGPCLVLTNYHVAFGQDYPPIPNNNYNMIYNIGYSDKYPFSVQSELIPVAKGDLIHRDFVLSKDSNCNGARFGWYLFSNIPTEQLVKVHAPVLVVSFSGKHGRSEMALSMGNVTGVNPVTGNVMYSASTSPGSSGGPVFIVSETGVLLLQGIHVSGAKAKLDEYEFPTYSTEHANEFLNVTMIWHMQEFNRLMNADFIDHPEANPLKSLLQARH